MHIGQWPELLFKERNERRIWKLFKLQALATAYMYTPTKVTYPCHKLYVYPHAYIL